jgi:acyl-CoA reductase-like NAD-dependent aldehyde dehydrogenase
MLSQAPFEVPCIIDGKTIKTGDVQTQIMPHDHARVLAKYHAATPELVQQAIDGALKAKTAWEELPWADRAAIFLKAADLIAGKYRYELMAATMLGQGKNAWQAEIDAAAEVSECEWSARWETVSAHAPSSATSSASASSTSKSSTPSSLLATPPASGSECLPCPCSAATV